MDNSNIKKLYWLARQKFGEGMVISDPKVDAKLEVHKSIDHTSGRLTEILENYQNALYVYANEENELGLLLKEFAKQDKTTAGKVMNITGKCLTNTSLERIKLYKPLIRLLHEMDTFHSRAVDDTKETVNRLENKRTQYKASLLWMKNVSERLNPEIYKQMNEFRHVQGQVRQDKEAFDSIKMDVVQKIDLLMGSRCNLLNQTLAPYQDIMLETFQKNVEIYTSAQEAIKELDINEYEFKALKQLNPLNVSDISPATSVLGSMDRDFNLLDLDSSHNSSPTSPASPASPASPKISALPTSPTSTSVNQNIYSSTIEELLNLENSVNNPTGDLIQI